MKIHSAKYLKSAMGPGDYPMNRYPEFAFVGRSNVGKSSLLNCLLGRKGLAKTSGTPGKTQTINFFDVNNALYFVDLPGYGYAKVPLPVKKKWGAVVTAYLQDREPLRLVVVLLDARHPPNDNDAYMLEQLDAAEVPTLIVATKSDKLKRSQRNACWKAIRESLDLDADALIIPFSAVTQEGMGDVWNVIDELLADEIEE